MHQMFYYCYYCCVVACCLLWCYLLFGIRYNYRSVHAGLQSTVLVQLQLERQVQGVVSTSTCSLSLRLAVQYQYLVQVHDVQCEIYRIHARGGSSRRRLFKFSNCFSLRINSNILAEFQILINSHNLKFRARVCCCTSCCTTMINKITI